MTREEIIRNLKYTMEKHKNDRVYTFDTTINYLKRKESEVKNYDFRIRN